MSLIIPGQGTLFEPGKEATAADIRYWVSILRTADEAVRVRRTRAMAEVLGLPQGYDNTQFRMAAELDGRTWATLVAAFLTAYRRQPTTLADEGAR